MHFKEEKENLKIEKSEMNTKHQNQSLVYLFCLWESYTFFWEEIITAIRACNCSCPLVGEAVSCFSHTAPASLDRPLVDSSVR